MLRSMTGFGNAQAKVEGVEYAVEIRSVNNRYFKPNIKLPEAWSAAETEIERIIRKKIYRGSVAVKVQMRISDDIAVGRINTAVLNSYLEQLKMVEVDADPTLRIDLGSLLQLSGVCEGPALDEICQATHDGMIELIEKALADLVEMRCCEGKATEAELLGQCDVVDEAVAQISKRAPDVVKEYHTRLTARVQELTEAARVSIDADILAREVAIFADRCDIAEEIARLKGHLDQFRQAVTSSEPVGRKLDFIAQEMLREANTIASKANDAEIGRVVVDIKTAIDRIKEQAANVE